MNWRLEVGPFERCPTGFRDEWAGKVNLIIVARSQNCNRYGRPQDIHEMKRRYPQEQAFDGCPLLLPRKF
jgi:hypothetical protein